MAAPNGETEAKQKTMVSSSPRRRKGTFASRYLEAIQCPPNNNNNATLATTTRTKPNSFRSTPIAKRETGKSRLGTADCAGSIFTASTAMMINPSDSLSTANTSPVGMRSPARRGRGRSRTPTESGTNSSYYHSKGAWNEPSGDNHCEKDAQEDFEYIHVPGSRSTAPLSGSAPNTPSRHSLGPPAPMTPYSAKSIMGIDCDETSTTSQEHRDFAATTVASSIDECSEESSLKYLSIQINEDDETDTREKPEEPMETPKHQFSKSNPRTPSESPGPQPKSPGQPRSHWELHQALGQPRAFEPKEPTTSEAGAPTEIMKNFPQKPLKSPYALTRSPRRIQSTNDILERVRNRFRAEHDDDDEEEKQMPSLLDSQSSSVSSMPTTSPEEKKKAKALRRQERSKLARHVENARKQSLFAPSVSDTTASDSVDSGPSQQLSSLNGETGSHRRLGATSLSKLLDAEEHEETTPALVGGGGLRKRPVGAQVAALAAHYRKGNTTARGAQLSKEETAADQRIVPDPILSIDASHDEESTMPECDGDDFIAYNQRSKPKTEGVFQRKGSSSEDETKKEEPNGRQGRQRSKGRHHDRRGKSPIQPLFSSERLDESNNSSIHESSIRSKSLGRTMSSKEFLRMTSQNDRSRISRGDSPPPLRSKSLSEGKPAFKSSMELSAVMGVPGNIVVAKNNENDEDAEVAQIVEQSSKLPGDDEFCHDLDPRPSSAPSLFRERAKTPTFGTKTKEISSPRGSPFTSRPSSAMEFASFKQGSTNDLKSIKDKIRAYNLKRSPFQSRSTSKPTGLAPQDGRYSIHNHGRKFVSKNRWTGQTKSAEEEKKEIENVEDDSSVRILRDKLERRYLEAHLGVRENDDSDSSNNDEYSVQSLREQYEQRMRSSHKNDDDDDDDDNSVRNLRERFEPQSNKHSSGAISHLRARFEPKPRAPFTALRAQKQGEKKAARVQEKQNVVEEESQTTPYFNSAHSHLNEWSKRHQIDHTIPLANGRKERRESIESTHSTEIKTNVSTAKNSSGRFMNVRNETGKASNPVDDSDSSKDDHEHHNVPGSHWNYQKNTTHELRRDDTKGSSTDSDFSDAVTLDPSFAEVSILSNPSAIRTLPSSDTERTPHSDASSSLLFEHLANKVPEIQDAITKSQLENQMNIDEVRKGSRDAPGIVTPEQPKKILSMGPYGHHMTFSPGDSTARHWSMFYSNSSSRSSRSLESSRVLSASSSKSPRSLENTPKVGIAPITPISPVLQRQNGANNNTFTSKEEKSAEVYLPSLPHKTVAENTRLVSEFSDRTSRSMDADRRVHEPSSYRSTRSADFPHRVPDATNRSARSSEVSSSYGPSPSHSQANSSDFSRHAKSNPSGFDDEPDGGKPALENLSTLPSQPAVPPLPSPFDENYATIMESRHKMLLSRQRTLLNRRANREKQQTPQQQQQLQRQGFFGRTKPSTLSKSGYDSNHSRGSSDSSSHGNHSIQPNAYRKIRDPTYNNIGSPSRAAAQPAQSFTPSSFVSRITRTLGSQNTSENESSQKKAVIDRISAVRAARMRRNQTFGDTPMSSSGATMKQREHRNYYFEHTIRSGNLDTINGTGGANTVSPAAYRYYPHNDSLEQKLLRDDELSFGTNESNAQEYAAKLSID